jgi:hypothetical protein
VLDTSPVFSMLNTVLDIDELSHARYDTVKTSRAAHVACQVNARVTCPRP